MGEQDPYYVAIAPDGDLVGSHMGMKLKFRQRVDVEVLLSK